MREVKAETRPVLCKSNHSAPRRGTRTQPPWVLCCAFAKAHVAAARAELAVGLGLGGGLVFGLKPTGEVQTRIFWLFVG